MTSPSAQNAQNTQNTQATQNTDPYGYLLVHFLEDPDGYAERIYMDFSDGDNPCRWLPLNGGKPVLTSNIGTTGMRDPHITHNPETGEWIIVATDLRVYGDPDPASAGLSPRTSQGWEYWSHHGSTNLIVWRSNDLVHWQGPSTLDVARPTNGPKLELGMAWACESLWVPDYYPEGHAGGRGAFVIYWSSKLFPNSDTAHTTPDVYDQVLWGVTQDFTQETYEYGGVFIDTGGNSIDTTMIQRRLPGGGMRTYRITKDNSFGNGIWMDSTDAPRWWESSTEWHTIQTQIGAEYTGGDPGGVEGPAVFAANSANKNAAVPDDIANIAASGDTNNNAESGDTSNKAESDDTAEWYLFVDVIPEIGYRPMISTDLDSGWKPLDDPDFFLSPHTKHGGVISLTRADYEHVHALL